MVYGKVYLVGAGPGDPQLLTIKAVRVLKEADVLIYDRLGVGEEILCLVPEKAERFFVGKRTGLHEVPQDKITKLIVEKAKKAAKSFGSKAATHSSSAEAARKQRHLLRTASNLKLCPVSVPQSLLLPTQAYHSLIGTTRHLLP
jgi:precorrin-4 methylase